MIHLLIKKILRHEMTGIKPKKHKLFTYKNNKLSTSCFDNKCYILKNWINTLHMDTKTYQKMNKIIFFKIYIRNLNMIEKD